VTERQFFLKDGQQNFDTPVKISLNLITQKCPVSHDSIETDWADENVEVG
jgi:hypothetical protein